MDLGIAFAICKVSPAFWFNFEGTNTLPIPVDILSILKQNEFLANISDKQLYFLIDKGTIAELAPGDFLFEKGKPADNFEFILSGKLRVYLTQKDQKKEISVLQAGEITGLLPYSRMTVASGYGQAVVATKVLLLHRDHFPEMIRDYHALTEALVHFMASRIRTFTSSRMQDEKLMSLGKLSAGLAHELNNPASAMVRSSEALLKHLKLQPEGFKAVMNAKLAPKVVDEVNDWLFKLLANPPKKLTLSERSTREDALTDLLDSWDFDDSLELAENLVEFNISEADLHDLKSKTNEEGFATALRWIVDNMNTERMVEEINISASRIAELIRSIKEYSHMDQGSDRALFDINQSIETTLTMLKHKAKTNKVAVELALDEALPRLSGFPGQLKQVWTNVIDNAIDAMEEKGGTLTVKTEDCPPFLKVHISDTGSGIPEDVKNQIFDPFFTTKKIGKGTGMGLDIVQKIIARHRGQIEVDSKPGRTTFTFSFPEGE